MKYTALLLFMCLSVSALAEEVVYVHANNAKLFSSPAFDSSVIMTVERGTKVDVLDSQQRWLKIRYQNSEGWIAKLLVRKEAPLAKAPLLEQEKIDLSENARRRASASGTTAAARGLRDDGRTRASDDTNSDFNALTQMENNKVSEQEAVEFLKQEIK